MKMRKLQFSTITNYFRSTAAYFVNFGKQIITTDKKVGPITFWNHPCSSIAVLERKKVVPNRTNISHRWIYMYIDLPSRRHATAREYTLKEDHAHAAVVLNCSREKFQRHCMLEQRGVAAVWTAELQNPLAHQCSVSASSPHTINPHSWADP